MTARSPARHDTPPLPPLPPSAVQRAGLLFAVSFEPAEYRVGQTRRITAALLHHRGLGAVLDPAVLVVSELVTNAVRHGRGNVGLTVTYSAVELRIEVSDGSTAPARLRTAEETDESGRGLWLVAAVAREWGASDDGTVTWCTLALPAGPS
ncbi:ATP-binding protein [Streptomyces sp. TRM76323]|uniref:ATP-binding protein n=1 Tax=Streptomyces tamarix TaxID=3078565 RepID=A0ABU3QHL2_9ACTN|nr:ATP-binding protein [Streptomyces tamarix]MDT9682262.1 ATP-binding protein [Streptomyces tamarix]